MSRNTFTYNRQMKPTPTNLQLKSSDGIVSEMPTSRTPKVEHFLQENTTKSNKSLQQTGDNFRCVASTDSFSSPTECVTYFGNLQQDLKDFLKEYNTMQRRPTPSPFQLLSNATPTIELVSALVSMKRKRNVSIEQYGMENEEISVSKDDAEMNSVKERDSLNRDHLNLNVKLHKNHAYKQTCGADKLIEAQGELKNTTEALENEEISVSKDDAEMIVSALVSMKRNRSVTTEQNDMKNEEIYTSNNNTGDEEPENITDYSNPKAKIHKNNTCKQTCGADKLIEAQGELKNTTEASVFFSAPKKKKQLIESNENVKNETNWLRNELRESDVTCNADILTDTL
eukprot:CAMPEP_0194298136 /NCGR_PEP_ID=MMETSP0169-20130528/59997_1 /TAXON_ID=218684 /ORGANISM="Corethron pennatum, Strain L29A3" /LENGTH=341 /DNA_ID=CAMNT_0039048085 /DNA_START=56 /DNA_END=1082 /DNA_ORIENTATION=+